MHPLYLTGLPWRKKAQRTLSVDLLMILSRHAMTLPTWPEPLTGDPLRLDLGDGRRVESDKAFSAQPLIFAIWPG